MLLAEPAGRLLERPGNRAPRGMTVHDRTRLIGQLLLRFFVVRCERDICRGSASLMCLQPERKRSKREGDSFLFPMGLLYNLRLYPSVRAHDKFGDSETL